MLIRSALSSDFCTLSLDALYQLVREGVARFGRPLDCVDLSEMAGVPVSEAQHGIEQLVVAGRVRRLPASCEIEPI